jgi:hypothetical protein
MSSGLLEKPTVADVQTSPREKPTTSTPNPVSADNGGVSYQVQNPSEPSEARVLVALSPEENARRWKSARETHKVSSDFHPHH